MPGDANRDGGPWFFGGVVPSKQIFWFEIFPAPFFWPTKDRCIFNKPTHLVDRVSACIQIPSSCLIAPNIRPCRLPPTVTAPPVLSCPPSPAISHCGSVAMAHAPCFLFAAPLQPPPLISNQPFYRRLLCVVFLWCHVGRYGCRHVWNGWTDGCTCDSHTTLGVGGRPRGRGPWGRLGRWRGRWRPAWQTRSSSPPPWRCSRTRSSGRRPKRSNSTRRCGRAPPPSHRGTMGLIPT